MGNLDCNEGRQEHGTDTGPATQRAALQNETRAHTEGPWQIGPYSSAVGCMVLKARPERTDKFPLIVASLPVGDVSRANAALICAAPELLEALQNIIANARMVPDPAMGNATDCYGVPLDDIWAAERAIAKATGVKS